MRMSQTFVVLAQEHDRQKGQLVEEWQTEYDLVFLRNKKEHGKQGELQCGNKLESKAAAKSCRSVDHVEVLHFLQRIVIDGY